MSTSPDASPATVSTRDALRSNLAAVAAGRRDGRPVTVVVHPDGVDHAARLVVAGATALQGEQERREDARSSALGAALVGLPPDVHGPDAPFAGFVVVLRLGPDALHVDRPLLPRGMTSLLARRLRTLWSAALQDGDLEVPLDDRHHLVLVRGSRERVDGLVGRWREDVAAFAPAGHAVTVHAGIDAPDGDVTLDSSALAAIDAAVRAARADVPALEAAVPDGDDELLLDVLRRAQRLAAREAGLHRDPGPDAARMALAAATRAGLSPARTTCVVTAATFHLLPPQLVAGGCGDDVARLLADDGEEAERTCVHAGLREGRRLARRHAREPRAA